MNKIRLISIEELTRFGYVDKTSSKYYENSTSTPYWLSANDGDYWVMNSSSNSLNKTFMVFDYNSNISQNIKTLIHFFSSNLFL